MKKRDLVIITLLFVLCIGFTSDIVSYQLTGNHLIDNARVTAVTEKPTTCTTQPIPSRPKTTDSQLKALPEYEQACSSAFLTDMMIFTNMPISVTNAQMYADKMAVRLKEFNAQHITPIVIAEPDSDWGLIDFAEFANGNYDAWISAYFARLKTDGITDQSLGLWIPFPEPQQPYWNNNGNPDDFAHSINRYFTSMRSVFPKARTGILLDSQVSADRQASQVLAYTRLVDNTLVDVAGLQGFPWHPSGEKDARKPITSASEFAPASLLDQVAKSLNTKEVLFNIGTYRHRKIDNGGDIAITNEERKSTLDSIVHESNILTDRGYRVTVNVFAQNKFNDQEGVDWSYWDPGNTSSSSQTLLFTNFVHELIQHNTDISIFDSRD